ncbi:23S rRNA pseudouridine(2604) synthase RluF [Paenibacillus pini]|uniref:Pseudouridine synthase n=2 Tax=Paenibacillus TaxID=44249 RepID=W7YDB8_9BACL|nr:ribosomal large subunit pseudouridine synthase F [Paenibacillus pini JCM 16418]
MISEGRITINDVICEPGAEVTEGDLVLIDGEPIPKRADPVYILLHKPVGITCTAAKHVEGNIIDFVNYPSRIFAVGRLDKASEGLILLTNDGAIVNKMMRSEHGHEKEYVVTVDKPITDDFLYKMSSGIEILGVTTKRCVTTYQSEYVFRIILTEGLNLQIRRMCKELGYRVLRLERIRIMNMLIEGIDKGTWRDLTPEELEILFEQLN